MPLHGQANSGLSPSGIWWRRDRQRGVGRGGRESAGDFSFRPERNQACVRDSAMAQAPLGRGDRDARDGEPRACPVRQRGQMRGALVARCRAGGSGGPRRRARCPLRCRPQRACHRGGRATNIRPALPRARTRAGGRPPDRRATAGRALRPGQVWRRPSPPSGRAFSHRSTAGPGAEGGRPQRHRRPRALPFGQTTPRALCRAAGRETLQFAHTNAFPVNRPGKGQRFRLGQPGPIGTEPLDWSYPLQHCTEPTCCPSPTPHIAVAAPQGSRATWRVKYPGSDRSLLDDSAIRRCWFSRVATALSGGWRLAGFVRSGHLGADPRDARSATRTQARQEAEDANNPQRVERVFDHRHGRQLRGRNDWRHIRSSY